MVKHMRTEIKYINGIKVVNIFPDKATDEERERFLYGLYELLQSFKSK